MLSITPPPNKNNNLLINNAEKNIILGDTEIRIHLRKKLISAKPTPIALIDELRVHKGNAIADVVSLHKYAHCYEIKSDKDNIEKAQKQAEFYDLVFQKVTLVTTERHLTRALRILPPYWGILIAKESKGKIVFRYIRKATISPHFDKKLALLTLWKSELIFLAEPLTDINLNKYSRESLSELLSGLLSSAALSKEICNSLINRTLKKQYL